MGGTASPLVPSYGGRIEGWPRVTEQQPHSRSRAAALIGAVRPVDARVAAIVSSRPAGTDGAVAVEANRLGVAATAVDSPGRFVLRAAELRELRVRANRIAQPVDAPIAVTAAGPLAQPGLGLWIADLLALLAPASLDIGMPPWRALEVGPADQLPVLADLLLALAAERGNGVGAALAPGLTRPVGAHLLAGAAQRLAHARPVGTAFPPGLRAVVRADLR